MIVVMIEILIYLLLFIFLRLKKFLLMIIQFLLKLQWFQVEINYRDHLKLTNFVTKRLTKTC